MKPEELQKIKDVFPDTPGAKLVLAPWIENALLSIEQSWHNDDAAIREVKATEKKLLERLVKDLKLELNPDIPQSEFGRSKDSESDGGSLKEQV